MNQPIGATGTELAAAVKLHMELDVTKANQKVSCFVLDSSRPLWQGELQDCGVLLGTNALVDLGIEVTHRDGSVIAPSPVRIQEEDNKVRILRLTLEKTVHLMPQQSKWVRAIVEVPDATCETTQLGMISLKAEALAEVTCDFLEGLWSGEQAVLIPMNNWSSNTVLVTKGTVVGQVEGVDLVGKDDPFWKKQVNMNPAVRNCVVDKEQIGHRDELKKQLCIGDVGSIGEQNKLLEILLARNETFVLNDLELGETEVVQHNINTNGAPPVKTSPRRIPYTLRKELEKELDNLLKAGCIEASNSPYSSALVLVRKKEGGLRVCVDYIYRALNKDTIPDRFPIP